MTVVNTDALRVPATPQVPKAAQVLQDRIAQIAPTADFAFRGDWDKFVFWLGRMLSMLTMRYSQTLLGGATKVAQTFKTTIDEAVVASRRYHGRGEGENALGILYTKAYELALLNETQIQALTNQLALRPDQIENDTMLSTFKRAALLGKLPAINAALQRLVTSFEAKLRAAEPAPLLVPPPIPAPVPVPVPPVPVPPVPIDAAALKEAKLMPSPATRHAAASGHAPSINQERLVVKDFKAHLRVDAHRCPDFTAVKALGARLDAASEIKARRVLQELFILEQLHLYEVSEKHKGLLTTMITESYEAMPDIFQQKVIRAYLVHNKSDVNVNYDDLLAKIRT